MERIWAPWRMEYVTQTHKYKESCFLCIGDKDDKESLVVARLDKAFIMMNRYPYSNGHVMVAPQRHISSVEDLEDEEVIQILGLIKKLSAIFREDFKVDGLNIGINIGKAAGAGLEEHIHVHVVPRWFGDTNFMPVIAETKVISEHLYSTYEKLKKRFEENFG
ncbi:MAG: HIT domain-containing protein [Deltaproteobacteria bacterium]|nr:HIT domain-containing protein [Deltaproteobacteria bacterium]